MTSRRYDVSGILSAKESAGGWNELAKRTGINRGTLKYIGEGKRNPSHDLAKQLVKLKLIAPIRRTPRLKPIPWQKVAKALAIGRNHMVGALVTNGIDHERAEEIAARVWG